MFEAIEFAERLLAEGLPFRVIMRIVEMLEEQDRAQDPRRNREKIGRTRRA